MRSSAESWVGDVGGIVSAEDDDMLDRVEWESGRSLSHVSSEGRIIQKKK